MANADKVTDVLVALRSAGIHLSKMSVQKPTLEQFFDVTLQPIIFTL